MTIQRNQINSPSVYAALTRQLRDANIPGSEIFLQSFKDLGELHDDPTPFREAFKSVMASDQVELDLHLVGAGIHNHEAKAGEFSKLIGHIAGATKRIAKDIQDKVHASADDILIQGVQPGSVRVVLRAPDAKRDASTRVDESNGQESPLTDDSTMTVESQALWEIGHVFTAASENDEVDDEFDSGLIKSSQARDELKKAVDILKKNNWEIKGTASRRGVKPATIQLTARGANKLSEMLKASNPVTVSKRVDGQITGHRAWDDHAVFIQPDHGRRLVLHTSDLSLLRTAAELAADGENKVTVTYEETTYRDESGSKTKGVGRELKSIRLAPEPFEFNQESIEIDNL